ncbi:MAG: hypothetical protein ACEQSB_05640 [Undibacterium sp.]
MTQSSQSVLARRGSPNLHLAIGRHWREMIRRLGALYMGQAIPGSARSPAWQPNKKLTVDAAGVPRLSSNFCRHESMRLVVPGKQPPYHTPEQLHCPKHRLVYERDSDRVVRCGAMSIQPEALPPCPPSEPAPFVWRGLVFDLGAGDHRAKRLALERDLDFIASETGDCFDFTQYEHARTLVSPQNADLPTTIVNFRDIRHLANHPSSLGHLVDVQDYTPKTNDCAIVQRMGFNPRWYQSGGAWSQQYRDSGLPDPIYGAVWAMLPDGFMLEWYPGVIVVSVILPDPNDPWCSVLYHDFYYHREAKPAMQKPHQEVFITTGKEDEEWCESTTDFLRLQIAEGQGDEEWGFLDPVQEDFAIPFYAQAARWLKELGFKV